MPGKATSFPFGPLAILTVLGAASLLGGTITAIVVGLLFFLGGYGLRIATNKIRRRIIAQLAMGTGAAVIVAGVALGVLTDRAEAPVRIGPDSGFVPSSTSTSVGPATP